MKVTRAMVKRFLEWPLPYGVIADYSATKIGHPGRTGKNLLNAEQARRVLEYVLDAPTDRFVTDAAPGKFTVDAAPGSSTPTGGTFSASKLMGKDLWIGGTSLGATNMTISRGAVTMTLPLRTEKTVPDTYRLAKKQDGTLVLQGAYMWQEGWNKYGHEWRDIPTVDLDKEDA